MKSENNVLSTQITLMEGNECRLETEKSVSKYRDTHLAVENDQLKAEYVSLKTKNTQLQSKFATETENNVFRAENPTLKMKNG